MSRRLDWRGTPAVREAFYPELHFGPAAEEGSRELRLGRGGSTLGGSVWNQACTAGWAYLELPCAPVLQADPETVGTFPAEVLVNLLLRVNRPAQALTVARRFLTRPQSTPPSCPSIVELCRMTGDYKTLSEVAREQGDPVHFMAGLLAAGK